MLKGDKKISTKKLIWIAAIIFSLLAVVTVYTSDRNDGPINNTESPITRDVAEQSCQEVANTKLQGRDIDVIDLNNYNLQFNTTENKSTLSWNGKSKDSDQRHAFVCELTGTAESPNVTMLQMGSERLQ